MGQVVIKEACTEEILGETNAIKLMSLLGWNFFLCSSHLSDSEDIYSDSLL